MRPWLAALSLSLACCRSHEVAVPASRGADASTLTVDAAVEAGPDAGLAHPERAFALAADPSCAGDLRCLVEKTYPADEKARALALSLYDESGDAAGSEHAFTMDGGFRGTLHIAPAFPTEGARVQLERVLAAARDFETFFHALYPAGPPPSYRWRDLTFRFFRSRSGAPGHEVERTTPSAYAMGPRPMPHGPSDDISFSLAFNVKGSLVNSDTGVRETLFHEIFHMNDAAHGDWSPRALATDYGAIVRKCGAMNVTCLGPYAPNDTMVRGGTYYAFEPNNGLPVREYAAELALRWYREHRALLRNEPMRAFKCGPPENRRSWDAMVREFFGVDRVPPCPG